MSDEKKPLECSPSRVTQRGKEKEKGTIIYRITDNGDFLDSMVGKPNFHYAYGHIP